ncbi:winged-helix domain-containing protein [Halostagnicola sp. A-GB9-2]|uniref:winged-helix domain-containing protein n=1 Tax=Halostagnicola sp. A-GB9-2 TaxID=3048066 RepID=UPI0024BFCA21|nr:winged-helix domain-containing protein [Halostagnicola sp. A-GB9-2]MDJ1431974.1 winged-helix domain-containing protein [Halostagnicola sp. A-GB9-2]
MSLKDGLILEFLAEHDLELPAKPLYRNLNRHGHEIGYSTVRQRLGVLEDYGLIEKVDEAGYYAISSNGEAYLAGNLDVSELESED